MELDIDEFISNPSVQQFNKFRKRDLLQIADVLNISVVSTASKQVIKSAVFIELVKQGFLCEESEQKTEMEKSAVEAAVSADSVTVESDLVLQIQLKELELQIKRQEHENHVLQIRKLEMTQKEASSLIDPPAVSSALTQPRDERTSAVLFDPSKHIKLVPPFRESEVDAYFIAFERIAAKLKWPKDMWALMLQCSLVGKAQEVCSSLPIEESLNYDSVKAAVLRVYELVPEAYRQKFRNYTKSVKQTFVSFARDKKVLLEKWCAASKTTTFEQLQELILLEDFKSCLPDNLVVYLNEQKSEFYFSCSSVGTRIHAHS